MAERLKNIRESKSSKEVDHASKRRSDRKKWWLDKIIAPVVVGILVAVTGFFLNRKQIEGIRTEAKLEIQAQADILLTRIKSVEIKLSQKANARQTGTANQQIQNQSGTVNASLINNDVGPNLRKDAPETKSIQAQISKGQDIAKGMWECEYSAGDIAVLSQRYSDWVNETAKLLSGISENAKEQFEIDEDKVVAGVPMKCNAFSQDAASVFNWNAHIKNRINNLRRIMLQLSR